MTARRAWMYSVLCVAVIVAVALTLRGCAVSAAGRDCRRLGAHQVRVGSGDYLCVSPDGRIVGP